MKTISEAYIPKTDRQRSFEFYLEAAVELLLRPEQFFRAYLGTRPFGFPILAIWVVGMGAVVERIESGLLKSETLGSESFAVADKMLSGWPSFGLYVALVGVLAGVFVWLIMGWWYCVRLEFSGANGPDPREARLVLIHARLVASVPMILSILLLAPFHESYEAMSASGSFALVWVTAPVWSIFVGYRGAIGCFDVDLKRARVWFLVLPLALLVGVMTLFALAGPPF